MVHTNSTRTREAGGKGKVAVVGLQSKILNKQASFFFYISSASPFPDPKIGNLLSILSLQWKQTITEAVKKKNTLRKYAYNS